MKIHNFPDFPAHKAEYYALTRQVLDLQGQFTRGEMAMSIKVGNFLKDWLKSHISGTDLRYSPFLLAHGVK